MLQNLFGRGEGDGDDAGARAERFAAEWLRRERRFTVVAQNWRNPRDRREELDLVCTDHGVLVFVEVKARTVGAMVPGYFAVNRRKKRVMLSAAKAYLARLSMKPRTFRCDIVEIELPVGASERNRGLEAATIRHFENVPLFPKSYRG
jgi:putative endonuclease